MRNHSNIRSARGFSLIEVLIAVVILSVGLLALASLQVNLIRSSADTKARSVAMALAKQEMETLFSFRSVGGTINCIDPLAGGNNTCYRAIDTATPADITEGGVLFHRQVDVDRYVYDISSGHEGFWDTSVSGIGNTDKDATFLGNPLDYIAGKEFKKVTVTVSWTDAEGSTIGNQAQIEDAINAIEPSDSAAVSKANKGAEPRKAKSIITNPASVAGVIPIAIGNGSDTAATNPRPIIVGQGQNTTAVETRFDVYTYAALNGTAALAQSRVETAVVGCTCTMTSATHTANRPTYWDGTQYTIPTTSANIPVSAPKSGNSVTQSDLCTSCCRDHFDPSVVTGEKFDPRRTTHNHYLASNLSAVVDTTNPGDYNEACRLIRVDGTFHVASEPYDDHYGQLATVSLANSTAAGTTVTNAVPATGTGSVSELYQTFVINYLAARFVNATAYNTVLDPTTVTGYSSLQTPATAYIEGSSTDQNLHSRGLLIDYLSTEAIAAITAAKADCAAQNAVASGSCPDDTLQTNILKLLPFTSINTTELAYWTANNGKVSVTSLSDLKVSIDQAMPQSGSVHYNNGNPGDSATTTSSMQGTSAGLAVLTQAPIVPASAYPGNLYTLSDTQPFLIGSGVITPTGDQFSVALAGSDFLTTLSLPSPWNVTFGGGTPKSCTAATSIQTPFTCNTDATHTIGGSTNINVSNYNRNASKNVQNSCTNNASDDIAMPYSIDFDVQSATVDAVAAAVGTVTNPTLPGPTGESTLITANPVVNGSVVTVNFAARTYKCPANWSTYLDSAGDDGAMSPDHSNGSTVCIGSGNKTPAWDTTSPYVACWSGFTP